LYVGHTKYTLNKFCLEVDEDSSQKFIPMVCTQEEQVTALIISKTQPNKTELKLI